MGNRNTPLSDIVRFRRWTQMPLCQPCRYIAQNGNHTRAVADATRALRPQPVEMHLKFSQKYELIGVDHHRLGSAPVVNG